MRLGKVLAAVAAVSISSAPCLAAPASPASKLSVSSASTVRSSSADAKANKLNGGNWFIPALAIAAVVGGIVAATSGDSGPDSP